MRSFGLSRSVWQPHNNTFLGTEPLTMNPRRLRVLTWHVHGNYLWYLSETPCDFILPVGGHGDSNRKGADATGANRNGPELGHGYGGRGTTFPFHGNVSECPIDELKSQRFDCVLFQSRKHYEVDQYELLSPAQRRLPKIYLEHDPPWEDVTDQDHWFDESNGMLVHVTHFNRLMWRSARVESRVIEHGVKVPESARYTGELPRGITALNHLARRGRKVGADIYAQLTKQTPVDLVGMAAEEAGGIGEIKPTELAHYIAKYRYFFSPIRYTSLGLAILEAMTVGLPIVGLATCELATIITNGCTGYLETDVSKLLGHMRRLADDPGEAKKLGDAARELACERFSIERFAEDWQRLLWDVGGDSVPRRLSQSVNLTDPTREDFEVTR